MGDFALALLPENEAGHALRQFKSKTMLKTTAEDVRIVEGDEYEAYITKELLDNSDWVGYTCVRDATTAGGSITELYESSTQNLPPWQEMIEVCYGMDPNFRSKGIATRAAKIAMAWAEEKFGVTRFVAATEPNNHKSQKLLAKLGFEKTDEVLFGEGSAEWRRSVKSQN